MIWVSRNRFHFCSCTCIYLSTISSLPSSKPFNTKLLFLQTLSNRLCLLFHQSLFSSILPSHSNTNDPLKYPKSIINPSPQHDSYSSNTNTTKPQNPRSKFRPKSIKKTPPPDPTQAQNAISQLPPRFAPEDLCKILTLQKHPLTSLQIFNWASQQPRFKHTTSTYLILIKKLGSAGLIEELDYIVNQALAVQISTSETFFNTIIYLYTQHRKLSRAITVYKKMKKCKDPRSRPSVRTYNLLFAALLSRGTNSYINHMYMETIRCLFRQMVNDGVDPDIFTLNSMIKGYVLSLHLNDALRIFHQMDAVYNCPPNAYSYDYLIHGLCAQGRTKNAKEFYEEMKSKGFVPSQKAYNSLVNGLAIGGEIEEAVSILWEMRDNRRLADLITYRTVLDAIGRQGRGEEAMRLLRELHEKDLIGGQTYRKLLYGLQDQFGDPGGESRLTAER